MRSTAELREGFLSYFESKGHKRHPSAPLVPPDWDRSTLLTSAGMQPLMPYFLGREEPPAPLLATVQKCFRTPDIDEVGLDGYHLTFFEMLGNFSFGQYFKEGAIDFAWEFLFEHLKIDAEYFWVSVFAGDPELGLGEDEEAVRLWEQIGMPPERIVRLDRSHNFWSVGGPGPCGPDTELFYDRGEGVGCGRPECAPGCSCERFLEFWNLVFMEYELHPDGSSLRFPIRTSTRAWGSSGSAAIQQSADLGLRDRRLPGDHGLHRRAERSRVRRLGRGDEGPPCPRRSRARHDVSDRRRRTPSNEGRGYVLRRVIRRARPRPRRSGSKDLLRDLADVVDRADGRGLPRARREPLDDPGAPRGGGEPLRARRSSPAMKLFEDRAAKTERSPASDAFKLHDTYGFPIE